LGKEWSSNNKRTRERKPGDPVDNAIVENVGKLFSAYYNNFCFGFFKFSGFLTFNPP